MNRHLNRYKPLYIENIDQKLKMGDELLIIFRAGLEKLCLARKPFNYYSQPGNFLT